MNTTPTDASSIVLDRAVGALLVTAAGGRPGRRIRVHLSFAVDADRDGRRRYRCLRTPGVDRRHGHGRCGGPGDRGRSGRAHAGRPGRGGHRVRRVVRLAPQGHRQPGPGGAVPPRPGRSRHAGHRKITGRPQGRRRIADADRAVRYRLPGRRAGGGQSPTPARPDPSTCRRPWSWQCGPDTTPTPPPPSPADCSVRGGGLPPCRLGGGGCCTAGRVCEPGTSSSWPY